MKYAAVLLAVTLLAANANATTPDRAALLAMYSPSKAAPVVRRVNVVGSYATVLTTGGFMESSPVRAAILVQRFSFGWQALESLDFSCRLHDHALGARTERLLMRGMPKPSDAKVECGERRDAGPPADVQAVRRLMHEPLVPAVIVSHDWAVAHWYGAGGGMSLWRKRVGRWRLVQGVGGALGVSNMRRNGVPQSDWCKFGITGVKC